MNQSGAILQSDLACQRFWYDVNNLTVFISMFDIGFYQVLIIECLYKYVTLV